MTPKVNSSPPSPLVTAPSSVQAPVQTTVPAPVKTSDQAADQAKKLSSDGDIEAGDNLTIDEEGEEEAFLNDGRSTITDASYTTELLNNLQK